MFCGAGFNSRDDVMITGAAADIAFKLVTNRVVIKLLALTIDDIDRCHDHARRAEATL